MNIAKFVSNLFQKTQSSPAQSPTAVQVPPGNTDLPPAAQVPFVEHEDYFEVCINELYLANARKWLTEIAPVVFVTTEFLYDGEDRAVPKIVGPNLIEGIGQQVPGGTIIRNTTVAGTHPFRGGKLTLAVVLAQMPVKNYGRELLNVIEKTGRSFDAGTALGSYLKIADVLFGGIEMIFGTAETTPIVALRDAYTSPGYFALIDQPGVDPATLWVRENRLLRGPSLAEAVPLTGTDFVLYSILRPPKGIRSDVDKLPFKKLWDEIKAEGQTVSEPHWKEARARLLGLFKIIENSPDLTLPHSRKLRAGYQEDLFYLHKQAEDLMSRNKEANTPAKNEEAAALKQTLKELGL